jgi:hypothetical protein
LRHGSCGQPQHRAQAAHPAGVLAPANRKADEGSRHPDRNPEFEHINKKVLATQGAGEPVISVDTKKKELVGAYKNGGTDYRQKAIRSA